MALNRPRVKSSIEDAMLESLKGKPVKVYTNSGKALRGSLQRYDEKTLVISGRTATSPPTLVYKSQVNSVHEDTGDE